MGLSVQGAAGLVERRGARAAYPGDGCGDLRFSERGEALIGQAMFGVFDRAQLLEAGGSHIRHLELGCPRLEPPPPVIDAAAAALRAGEVGYTSPAGLPALRAALAARLWRKTGRPISTTEVTVSPANLIINQFLDITCNPRDRLVLFTPAFPTYWAAARHAGLEVVEVALDPDDGFALRRQHVDEALAARPRAIIVNSANNPSGAVYGARVLHYLAQSCDDEGIWLLSDETYAELCFGRPFASLAGVSHPRLVVMSSLSKVLAIPGFRVGWALAHPAVGEKLALSTSTLTSCLPPFAQAGCVAGLSVLDGYARMARTRWAEATAAACAALRCAPSLRHVAPVSGFYLFVDVRGTGLDDLAFAAALLEERHTAVTPGRAFGHSGRGWIRLALCGAPDDVAQGVGEVAALAVELTSGAS